MDNKGQIRHLINKIVGDVPIIVTDMVEIREAVRKSIVAK